MKIFALGVFTALSLATLGTFVIRQKAAGNLPVLYWVTNANPARVKQVETFQAWLKKNGYPEFELRLDSANNDLSKKLIQGVSGMGGDIMDVITNDMMPYLAESGIIEDITVPAENMGFGVRNTYPSLAAALQFRGAQYGYPCNVNVDLLIVNRAAFRKAGMEPPPETWDFATFERIGREYVDKANQGKKGERYFFTSATNAEVVLRRSYGLDIFNETMTGSLLADPRNAAMLEKLKQWTEEYRLIPSAADASSFAGESSGGGLDFPIFKRGYYAMLYSGRYIIHPARLSGETDYTVSQPPYAEFPNALIGARAASIYRGSKHPELAAYFLRFLASPEYNALITEDGDGLPPLPAAAREPGFLSPPDHANEKDFHGPFARAAETIAIPYSVSPYVNPYLVRRIDRDYLDAFKSSLFPAEECGRRAAAEIDAEIAKSLEEHPKLRPAFERDREVQAQIDARKAEGRKIPRSWVKNPFYLKYYEAKGLLEDA